MHTKTFLISSLLAFATLTLGCNDANATNTTETNAPAKAAVAPASTNVVASVCNISLTKADLDAQVDEIINGFPKENAPAPEQMTAIRQMFEKKIITNFLQTTLIAETAKKEGIVITDEMRQKAYEEFKKSTGQDFNTEMTKLSPVMQKLVKEELESTILIEALINKNVFSKMSIDDAIVNAEYDKVQKDITTTTADFDAYYAQVKAGTLTLEELAQKAPRFLPPQAINQKITSDQMQGLPQELRALIEATPAGSISEVKEILEGNQKVKVYIKVNNATPALTDLDALTKINELKKQLDAGADFATLAKENSACPSGARAGGDLGEFSRGMMDKAFEDASFKQPLNVVGEPVKSNFGYHLIKVVARDDQKGTARASHILVAPGKATMDVTVVSSVLPVAVTKDEIREALKVREAQPKIQAYLESIRATSNPKCSLYPELIAQ